MAFLPAAIGAGGSILGGMIGNKSAKSSAEDAAKAQQQLTQQTISQMEGYDSQQKQQARSAIMGLLGGGNPFFSAAGGLHPTRLDPGQDVAQFGGGPSAPGTFSMPPAPSPFGGQNPFTGSAPGAGAPGFGGAAGTGLSQLFGGGGQHVHIPTGMQPPPPQPPAPQPGMPPAPQPGPKPMPIMQRPIEFGNPFLQRLGT